MKFCLVGFALVPPLATLLGFIVVGLYETSQTNVTRDKALVATVCLFLVTVTFLDALDNLLFVGSLFGTIVIAFFPAHFGGAMLYDNHDNRPPFPNALQFAIHTILGFMMLGWTYGVWMRDISKETHTVMVKENKDFSDEISDAQLILVTSHHIIIRARDNIIAIPSNDVAQVISNANRAASSTLR